MVDDGSSWTFVASNGQHQCRCGGVNAYPSFADLKVTTPDRGRFALLLPPQCTTALGLRATFTKPSGPPKLSRRRLGEQSTEEEGT